MTTQEIKDAVNAGKPVYWCNPGYTVKIDRYGRYSIIHSSGHSIGLTHADGLTLNGKESDFYILEDLN
jgi:hypothetical protein